MKGFLFFVFVVLFYSKSVAQIPTGTWRTFVCNTLPQSIASGNGLVLAAYQNGIFELDAASNEISQWDAVNGLSDIKISQIEYAEANKGFFIGYENGNLDFWKDGKVTNIPDIKLSIFQGSKAINSIYVLGDFAYVATDFCIVKVNVFNLLVFDTYYIPGGAVTSVAILGDTIYALSPNKLYKIKKTQTNLLNPAAWIPVVEVPTAINFNYKNLVVFNENLCFVKDSLPYATDDLYSLQNNVVTQLQNNYDISSVSVQNNVLMVAAYGGFIHYNGSLNFSNVFNSYQGFGGFPVIKDVTFSDGLFWHLDPAKGLIASNGSDFVKFFETPGTPRNDFFRVSGANGVIAFSSGQLAGNNVTFNKSGGYIFKDEKWKLINAETSLILQNPALFDVISVAVDPKNEDRIAFGACSLIPLYTLQDGATVSNVYTPANSLLENMGLNNGFSYVTALGYDLTGNLWIGNTITNGPLKMLSKEGVMYSFNLPSQINNRFVNNIVVDKTGTVWMAVNEIGILAFNDNKTPSDLSDDKYKLITDAIGNGALPSKSGLNVSIDRDGELWIGCNEGFAILNNSAGILDAENGKYEVSRVKNNVDNITEYILKGTGITDIEIDGGNRKWMATSSSGIFLLSANGTEILQNFTKENSPLLSNSVLDMFINELSGEMFIITDNGMLSFRIDATEGDKKYKNVKVFPNPVMPEFNGVITIQGIGEDSDIKITDAAGNLVYKTVSNGGTATWNGILFNGEKAASGIYYIYTAMNQDKGKYVATIVMLHE